MTLQKLTIFIIIVLFVSCSKQDKASIIGLLENAPDDEMSYLEEVRPNSTRVIDSTRIKKNGRFKYKLQIKDPGLYQLRNASGHSLTLILSPGEKLAITADYSNFYSSKQISGSPNTERVNILHDSLRTTIMELNKIRVAYSELSETMPQYSQLEDSLSNLFAEIKTAHHRYSVQFILEDLKSLSNIAALYQEYEPNEYVFYSNRDIQFYKLVSDTLSRYYPQVHFVKSIKDNYQKIISNYNTNLIMQNADSVSYDIFNLDLPSSDNKNIELSSLIGKYVLLCFWSVNHEESIQNTLKLKSVYNKFSNDEFEIYQVAIDNSFELFKKRVYFEELKWVSVCDTAFPQSQTRSMYNVSSLPLNYLIDKEQKEIIAKNISPEKLENTLTYLLTQKH